MTDWYATHHDVAVPFIAYGFTLDLDCFDDIDSQAFERLTLCRFFAAWFGAVSWGPIVPHQLQLRRHVMQTQIAEQKNETQDLDGEIATAEQQLEKLKGAADDAKAEAERWTTTFEREPTEQSFAKMSVAKQRAHNALGDAIKFEGKTLALLRAAKQKQLDDAERAELREKLHWDRVTEHTNKIRDAILTLARTFDEEIPAIAAVLCERRDLAPRAGALGVRFDHVGFDRLIDEISAAVVHEIGPKQGGIDNVIRHVKLVYGGSGVDQTVRLEMQRPAPVPGSVIQ